MSRREEFAWKEWLLALGFVLSLGITALALVRSVHVVSSARQGEPIRPWMTVPYIARSYHVSSSILYEAVGLPSTSHDRRPLVQIAREQRQPVQAVMAGVQRALEEAGASPPPLSSPPARSAR